MFEGHYTEWRRKRVEKLVELLGGKDSIKDMRILELAAGHGHIANMLSEMGGIVTAAEGRMEHVDFMKRNLNGIEVVHIDQRECYNVGMFDIVLHWGILYHLSPSRWRQDISDAASHAPIMCLETEVCDSDDPNFILETQESGYDQSMDGVGVRPSAPAVEHVLSSLGLTWERHDDPALNTEQHNYDWKNAGTGSWAHGMRRFWICRRK